MKKALLTAGLLTGIMPLVTNSAEISESGHVQQGIASVYHDKFHGRRTASGQPYNKNQLSAAHKTLPLGSRIQVTDTKTGRSVVVRINDRGPFVRGRILDLSKQAARELGIVERGTARVAVKVLTMRDKDG
ncbi:septal ring lytic transglycosylase RlpA family protein [Caldichromatium japonicum]|uniref:Endolytic peptidoglycan transglycosylase RlpA n=1 Tax=Caldichromatium japonicum TaxID=2699430 RepID=A0A6G7VAG2_9GAMM|nr:septal ring lytic transglycosylase RlpA family protein [Caldichromatium japonicum]QIK36856.1 septal ring lytic transglycosylase RlpA family protein [Caldichromatium japonicum]